MRLLLPRPIDDADVAEIIGGENRDGGGAPWVYSNMVTTIDGAATVDGRSKGLGGAGDKVVFSALRSEADVIVVGAQTVRAERYRLPRFPTAEAATRRRERGQALRPVLCLVTRSGNLPDDLPLLGELDEASLPDDERPLIATTDELASLQADHRFGYLAAGPTAVDLAVLVRQLGERGHRRILCEGGPSLLGQLGAAGLVNEWNFTVAATIGGGDAGRPVHSATALQDDLMLDRVLVDDDSAMFCRYLRR